jgi:hypothetical protein
VTLYFAAALNMKLRVFIDQGVTATLMNWETQASSHLSFSSSVGSLHSVFVEYVALIGTPQCPIISQLPIAAVFWPEAISQSPFLLTPV